MCSRSIAGTAGSNPAEGADVRPLVKVAASAKSYSLVRSVRVRACVCVCVCSACE